MAKEIVDKSGKPVEKDGRKLLGVDYCGVVKDINENARTLVIVGTDETKDRDGDVISIKGWVLDNFLKNPVFLYGHDYHSVPIGAASKVVRRKNPDRLEFHEKFPSRGIYPFADMIFELFREKILNASSVGFIPIEWEPLDKDTDPNGWNGRKFIKQELLELSAVPVPSNPAALQTEAFIKAYNGKSAIEVMEELQNKVKIDDVLTDLNISVIEFEEEHETIMSQVPKNFKEEEIKEEDMDKLMETLKSITDLLVATQEKNSGIFATFEQQISELNVNVTELRKSLESKSQEPQPSGNADPVKEEMTEENKEILRNITEQLKNAIKTLQV
jgi:hypothetical protein